ncbi:UDP-4-amino-4,6-dideoxy-N-acetyl-beta-L-altrosamine transaminase [Marinobacter metalliresistant]|uniref:UDP-4-amino-4, 6-dideoxy-N-acetyl-beta-L-altrosamine transaminase n=1 Tax=Marinobacter metalliresistant TaxID=2961995 RepID=A0ABZ2W559_9GAMM
MIPYSRQELNRDDIDAVLAVLESDFLTQGSVVPAFEAGLADYVGASHGVAVNSATSALHLACLVLGVGAGDRVWTSPVSFVASANCAFYCDATVDFVDIDPATGNMDPGALASKLREADGQGLLPKVIIPVHYAGQPCDMSAIAALAKEYGVRLIEDASHALGASCQGELVGGGCYSDITVFSFHPVKMITTGEGGALVTNDQTLADRARLLRSHGITRDPAFVEHLDQEPWRYAQLELGFNYRMTDVEAALGISQLRRLDQFLSSRRRHANAYLEAFSDGPVTTLQQRPDIESSWHLMSVQVQPDIRGELFRRLRADGIGVNVHYMPIYWQPYYRRLGFSTGYCPGAEQFYHRGISLPLYTQLTEDERQRVVSLVIHHAESLMGHNARSGD